MPNKNPRIYRIELARNSGAGARNNSIRVSAAALPPTKPIGRPPSRDSTQNRPPGPAGIWRRFKSRRGYTWRVSGMDKSDQWNRSKIPASLAINNGGDNDSDKYTSKERIMAMIELMLLAMAMTSSVSRADSGVSVEAWGRGGALLYTLRRGNMTMSVTDWGATVTSLRLPDATTGKDVDIVLGFDSLEPYMNGTSPYFGTIVGRVANRIKDARFSLNGTTYFLTANDNGNTLHGGFEGYNKMFWRSREVKKDPHSPSVQFLLYSYNTEQGFPGDLDVSVTYTLSGNKELRIEMEASSRNKATPVNLAHHSYWNLGGHTSGSILNHKLHLPASHYTPVDQKLIPTGEIASVVGTPFDFLQPMSIGSRIGSVPGGYDHNFALDRTVKDEEGLFHAASLEEPLSGRKMEVWTNQLGIQFYSGNFIDVIYGKDGFIYRKYGGLCLETQGFPDAVNEPSFPSVILKSGRVYRHLMLFKFKA